MFYEKNDFSKCYKACAKWDLPFDKEQQMHELIIKRNLQDDAVNSKESQAARHYFWARMTEAIFKEELDDFCIT